MLSSRRYFAEVREWAVRLYFDYREEFLSDWVAMGSIAEKLGITPETLRKWVRRVEAYRGQRLSDRAFNQARKKIASGDLTYDRA